MVNGVLHLISPHSFPQLLLIPIITNSSVSCLLLQPAMLFSQVFAILVSFFFPSVLGLNVTPQKRAFYNYPIRNTFLPFISSSFLCIQLYISVNKFTCQSLSICKKLSFLVSYLYLTYWMLDKYFLKYSLNKTSTEEK